MSVTRTVYVIASSEELAEALCRSHDWGDDLHAIWAGNFRAVHPGLVLGRIRAEDQLFEGSVVFSIIHEEELIDDSPY